MNELRGGGVAGDKERFRCLFIIGLGHGFSLNMYKSILIFVFLFTLQIISFFLSISFVFLFRGNSKFSIKFAKIFFKMHLIRNINNIRTFFNFYIRVFDSTSTILIELCSF